MAVENDELEVLLSEKKNADDRIGSYYIAQSSILSVGLGTLVGVLGFAFSKNGLREDPVLIYILLALVAVAAIANLQATIFGGFALGYIHYKRAVLGERIKHLLELPENPLIASAHISNSPARIPISSATKTMIGAQTFVGLALYLGALIKALTGGHLGSGSRDTIPLIFGFVIVGALLVGSMRALFLYARAIEKNRNNEMKNIRRASDDSPERNGVKSTEKDSPELS